MGVGREWSQVFRASVRRFLGCWEVGVWGDGKWEVRDRVIWAEWRWRFSCASRVDTAVLFVLGELSARHRRMVVGMT